MTDAYGEQSAETARLGVRTGDTVRITSAVDSLDCTAEVSNDPQMGVAILAHGWDHVSSTRTAERLPTSTVSIATLS